MGSGWMKFAILGSTYARALQNRAVRTHGAENVNPATFAHVGAQPQARFDTDLSSYARQSGALAPTQQSRAMTQLSHDLPWQGEEHQAPAGAMRDANTMLDQRGLSHNTPTDQLTSHERIQQAFGAPVRAGVGGTEVGRARTGPRPRQQDPRQHLDEWQRQNPNKPRNWMPPADSTAFQPPQRQRTHAQTQVGSMGGWQPQATARAAPAALPAASSSPATAVLGRPAANNAATAVLKAPQPTNNMATAVLRKTAGPLGMAAGIGIPLAIGGGILASKPGIRADIADRFNAPGDIHQKDQAQTIPDSVMSQAQRAHAALTAHGIDPTGLRIAVDAPSGAGKTVLSKALAQQMGLRHHGLDWRPNLRFHQLTGGGDIEKTPYAPHAGEILEHQQLLRSYDPELFDVAIHIHKDADTIKQQVLKRGRGARTHDLLDYDKSISVGRKAFETLGGEAIDLGGGAIMKVRPREGWGNQLDQTLAAQGIDPTGLSRHQKLLSLHNGKRTDSGAGWTPYMKSPFTGGETAALAGSIPLGIMAARALAHH